VCAKHPALHRTPEPGSTLAILDPKLIAKKQLPRSKYAKAIACEQRIDIPPEASNNRINAAATQL
jgi:hypothetical protein